MDKIKRLLAFLKVGEKFILDPDARTRKNTRIRYNPITGLFLLDVILPSLPSGGFPVLAQEYGYSLETKYDLIESFGITPNYYGQYQNVDGWIDLWVEGECTDGELLDQLLRI